MDRCRAIAIERYFLFALRSTICAALYRDLLSHTHKRINFYICTASPWNVSTLLLFGRSFIPLLSAADGVPINLFRSISCADMRQKCAKWVVSKSMPHQPWSPWCIWTFPSTWCIWRTIGESTLPANTINIPFSFSPWAEQQKYSALCFVFASSTGKIFSISVRYYWLLNTSTTTTIKNLFKMLAFLATKEISVGSRERMPPWGICMAYTYDTTDVVVVVVVRMWFFIFNLYGQINRL